jgi:hypothetical protein
MAPQHLRPEPPGVKMLILILVSLGVMAGLVAALAWSTTRRRSSSRLVVGTAHEGANVAMHVVRLR